MTEEPGPIPWPIPREDPWLAVAGGLFPIALVASAVTDVGAWPVWAVCAVVFAAALRRSRSIRFLPAVRRISARIAAGATPWDAAAPWETRALVLAGRDRHARWWIPSSVAGWLLLIAGREMGIPTLMYGGLAAAAPMTYLALRSMRRGTFVVHSLEMPVRLGSTARFAVATDASAGAVTDLRYRLRCVRTTPSYRRSKPDARLLGVMHPRGERQSAAGPDEDIVVTFELPADLPGTVVSEESTTHWEMLVSGTTAWGEIAGVVQVPVYAA